MDHGPIVSLYLRKSQIWNSMLASADPFTEFSPDSVQVSATIDLDFVTDGLYTDRHWSET